MKEIVLDTFQWRDYQIPLLDAIENKGYKRVIAILPRRSGKDVAAWNLMIRQALQRIGIYWYILPTYSQGKKVIYDGMTNNGKRFLDFIPKELIQGVPNSQEMKIKLVNGSIIQIIGSDNVDSLVGANPLGCVFSEYALQNPRAYQLIRPILTANDGWAVFISTPRGRSNDLHRLWTISQKFTGEWFGYRMTVEETKHIPLAEIQKERESGEMSDDLIAQEYYCSFDMGVEGAYYTKYLDLIRISQQIGKISWDPAHPVHTAWDIGVRDSTAIIFFQSINNKFHIIDCYQNAKYGLDHYAKIVKDKPYVYGVHIAPHDIKVREFGTGMTRLDKAAELGISFTIAPHLSLQDGIEAVRSLLPRCFFDEENTKPLLKALENYRQEWDPRRQVYKAHPLHDSNSHFCDAARYMAISSGFTQSGTSPEELERRYREAVYGESLPGIFNDNIDYY